MRSIVLSLFMVVTVIAGMLVGTGLAAAAGPLTLSSTAAAQPFSGKSMYVDPGTLAAAAKLAYPATASYTAVIAGTPQARWFGDWISTASLTKSVDSYMTAATKAGKLPVLVVYAIPHRDCAGFSAGGLADAAKYSAWISAFRAGLARRAVAVVLEPDALAGADCLPAAARQDRFTMLKNAVTTLTADPGTSLYIDGGHSHWLSAAVLADRLTQVGVKMARGFSLNVANFYPTAEQISYGESVSNLLGGTPRYVIDTSRNGRGAAPAGPLSWCNPAGRALGAAPTAAAGGAHADALLWIKHPGESDGDCGRGEPAAGTWFNSYAVNLVKSR